MAPFSIRVSSKKGPKAPPKWVKRNPSALDFELMPYYYNVSDSAFGIDKVSFDMPVELMTPEQKKKMEGDWRYVESDSSQEVFTEAKVKSQKKGLTTLEARGRVYNVKDGEQPLWPVHFTTRDFLRDDVMKLDFVNHASVLYNTKQRYMKDQIYTWVGGSNQVLLSVNPYKDLHESLYSEEQQSVHKTMENKPYKMVPAHAYASANDAYDDLTRSGNDQTILISGESGAGKTETTKLLLEFYANKVGSHAADHEVAKKLLDCGPLLQAFGNAKTGLNHNSSRFGKFIRVSFSKETNKIDGAEFVSFMLEQTRVVHHGEDERNFHIFYQILRDEELKSKYDLGDVKGYRYLNQSKKSLQKDEHDLTGLDEVKHALKTLEFSSSEQDSIFKTLAAILNLGNIEFKDQTMASNVTGSKVVNEKALAAAADLLSVDIESLREVLTSHTITTRGETTAIALDAAAARDSCDGLAKMVYETLFSKFLVKHLNAAMDSGHKDYFIGMLDIFGFEVLPQNNLEQLLINYANEKLQQEMNAHSFDLERELYHNEGINYDFLKFVDNQPTIELLEGKPNGLLTSLNDEVNLPNGNDKSWHGKMSKIHAENPLFQLDTREQFKSGLSFQISHYAAVVKYDCQDFVKKNADKVYADAVALMASSSDGVLSSIFKDKMQLTNTKPVCAKFKQNLGDLLGLIQRTSSRYIRCVKPNAKMAPGIFEEPLVNKQLHFNGVYQTVDIRRGGYPFRIPHKSFAYQFSCINIGHKYQGFSGKDEWRNRCAEILNTSNHDFSDDVQIGKSMILYRVSAHRPLMRMRWLAVETTVLPKLQSFVRGCMARHYIHEMLLAERHLQKALDTANDIAMVRKGFEMVERILEWHAPNKTFLPAYPMKRYDAGKVLEKRLMEWEELESRMTEAASGQKPKTVSVTLYKLLIALCEEADGPLLDVKRTAAQEELYDFCQTLIHESEPGKLDAEAGPALQSLVRERMQAVSDKADELGYTTPTIDKVKFVLERLVYIDKESQDALIVVDGARMKMVLDESKTYKHTNPSLEEIERMFQLPEKEFVKLELAAAKRLKDKTREIHRRIRLKEIFYDEEGHKFEDVEQSGHSRSRLNYARAAGIAAMCGKTGLINGFLEWSEKPLVAPLTKMPGELEDMPDSKEVKKMKAQCKKMFVNLQKYMGDKKSSPKVQEKAGQAYVDFGVNNPDLRNELFFQVIKQLTKNPSKSEDSIERGWNMLSLLMSSFLPSGGFEDYLVMWIRKNKPENEAWRAYTSAIHKLQFEDEKNQNVKPRALKEIQSEFDRLATEGSRYSIAPGAFTGPTASKANKAPAKRSPEERVTSL